MKYLSIGVSLKKNEKLYTYWENEEKVVKKSHKKSNGWLRCKMKKAIMENEKHNVIRTSESFIFKCCLFNF